MDLEITEKEHDDIASKVYSEVERMYSFSTPFGYHLPRLACSFCNKVSPCITDVKEGTCTCASCMFAKRVKSEEDKLKQGKLAYRAEQLRDFAEI